MEVAPKLNEGVPEVLALRLAREIAMNLQDVETILALNEIRPAQWEIIQRSPYFQSVLTDAVTAWNSAINTEQRVKLKSAALFEEWLPEANILAHDRQQPLSGKVELMKLLKAAGIGSGVAGTENGGERFSVIINLGGDAKLSFEKLVTPTVTAAKIIDGELTQET
jgi:hypothetical protein